MAGMLTEAAARVPGLTPYERTVLVCLADHANLTSKRCWPSIGRISVRTGMSERQVHRVLKRLKALGHIAVIGKHGQAETNVYKVNLETKAAGQAEVPGAKHPPSQTTPVTQPDTSGPAVTPPLTGGHPNKITEQHQEQVKENKKTSANAQSPAGKIKSKTPIEEQEDGLVKIGVETEGKNEISENGADEASSIATYSAPLALTPLPQTVDSKLVARWKSGMEALGLTPVVVAGEAKMLKEISRNLGFDNAMLVVAVVTEVWTNFTYHCESKAGAFNSPKHPDIRYLYRYQGSAMNYIKYKIEAMQSGFWGDSPKCLAHFKKSSGASTGIGTGVQPEGKKLW